MSEYALFAVLVGLIVLWLAVNQFLMWRDIHAVRTQLRSIAAQSPRGAVRANGGEGPALSALRTGAEGSEAG